MWSKVKLYFNTLKYLRGVQVRFRIYYALRAKWQKLFKIKFNFSAPSPSRKPLRLSASITNHTSLIAKKSFRFLNLEHQFESEINWNYFGHGKLWVYNLCYFEYLHQAELSKEEGLTLINDFIEKQASIKDGLEPFPISLRSMNWIKFLTYHQIEDQKIDQSLYNQLWILMDNLEYHLLGNHLLENGFALLFGAYYFQEEKFYTQAKKILVPELEEQILADGAHFELTPMYHQLMLYRMLDCFNLAKNNAYFQHELLELLSIKASLMLGWLQNITFFNGSIPLFNDSANNIAPTTRELFEYAFRLNIKSAQKKLKESGYRRFNKGRYELIVDVGNVGPDYIPGHAHSDTLSFELYVDRKPFIVDTGISTYEKNVRRNIERFTRSHNTVQINGEEQSEVWGGFRVAKRAKATILEESKNHIKATHNGYGEILHERQFYVTDQQIKVKDIIHSSTTLDAKAYLHFHPDLSLSFTTKKVKTSLGNITFAPTDEIDVHHYNYKYASKFNELIIARQLEINFRTELEMTIAI